LKTRDNIVGVLLAGGKNTRMHEPKWSISYRGMPEWRRVKELVDALRIPFVVSCSRESASDFHNANVIVDAYDIGPAGGILSVMEKLENADAFLFIGCDLPFLEAVTLEAMIEAYTLRQSTVCASVFNETIEPMVSVWRREDYRKIADIIAGGDLSLRSILRLIHAIRVPVDPDQLANINTTEEKEASLKRLAKHKHE